MDSSVIEVQFGDPGENSHTNQSKYPNDVSAYGSFMDSDEDMQMDKVQYDSSIFLNEDAPDISDAAYGSYESPSGCLSLPASGNLTSTPFVSKKLPNTSGSDAEPQKHELTCPILPEANQHDEKDPNLHVARSQEINSVETFKSEESGINKLLQQGGNSVVSESVEESTVYETPAKPEIGLKFGPVENNPDNGQSTVNETPVKPETSLKFEQVENDTDNEHRMDFSNLCSGVTVAPFKKEELKPEVLSEDEDMSLPKSGTESSSSKNGSPSGPSCSGTSHRDMNSLSSDSENDLPDINMTLPLKKRKRESVVETISSSSCSEDSSDIDYANLTPEQIKTLIEQAKSMKRKCRCPKKKLADLPVKGPTKPSSHCNIGKGDWRETKPCEECADGSCTVTHRNARGGRRRYPITRSALAKTRARGTIGQDVPIIEISDEEGSPVPSRVASEVTISSAPAGDCIVLSSSDDDDDIVCEGVIKADPKPKPQELKTSSAGTWTGSPEVVVLNLPSVDGPPLPSAAPAAPAAIAAPAINPALAGSRLIPMPMLPLPAALGSDLDYLFPEIANDEDIWNEMNIFCGNVSAPSNSAATAPNPSQANASAPVPERPSTPEGWSCPICLESKTAVTEIMSTTCGHIFCGTCIRSAVRIHKKCPTCRKKLTAKQFHKIFL